MEGQKPDRVAEAESHYAQAYGCEESGDLEKALRHCDAALRIAPSLADAHNLRAIVLEEMGREDEALGAYRRAIVVEPNSEEAIRNLLDLERELGISHELTTIATFSYPVEAYIPKTKLKTEGIWSFVADETIVMTNWLYCNAVGRVKLQVREADVHRALQILDREVGPAKFAEDDNLRYPACGCFSTRYEKYSLRLVFASWLFLGFPLPFRKRKWKCSHCGHEWRIAGRKGRRAISR